MKNLQLFVLSLPSLYSSTTYYYPDSFYFHPCVKVVKKVGLCVAYLSVTFRNGTKQKNRQKEKRWNSPNRKVH